MTNTAIETRTPAHAVTARATEPVTAGQLVHLVTGTDNHPTVAVADDGQRVFGVAGTDADTGELFTVQRGPGRCFLVPTTATLAAGAELEAGADGQPVTLDTGTLAAIAVRAATDGHVEITLT